MISNAPQLVTPGDPTVKEGILHHLVRLAPDVTGVKTCTPLVPSPEGYRPSFQGVLFSAEAGVGGEEVVAYTACVAQIKDRAFVPGTFYTVTEIDYYGGLTFDPPPPVRTALTPPPPPTEGESVEGASVPGEASTSSSSAAASREAGARSARGAGSSEPAARSVAPAVTSVPGAYLALDESHLRFLGS